MSSRVHDLTKKEVIKPPKWLGSNLCLEVIMGSVAYGCSEDYSDQDIYGFCIMPKEMIFPHLAGRIYNFGKKKMNLTNINNRRLSMMENVMT